MVDNACVPDFSEFFGKQELSDVNVFLDEDNAAACTGSSAAGKKRKRSKKAPGPNEDEGIVQQPPLPGHSMVLVAFSEFFKAKVRFSISCCNSNAWRASTVETPSTA